MARPIHRLGCACLSRQAEPVAAVTPDVERLVDEMIETMYLAPGIGLAAPQVGLAMRIFVIDVSERRDGTEVITMINPRFEARSGMQLEEEGCLSLPGFTATVARPAHVVVHGQDRSGRPQRIAATGLLARAFQHEMDHLDGRLFIDRLRAVQRRLIVRRVHALERKGRWHPDGADLTSRR